MSVFFVYVDDMERIKVQIHLRIYENNNQITPLHPTFAVGNRGRRILVLCVKPECGQKIASHALPTAWNSAIVTQLNPLNSFNLISPSFLSAIDLCHGQPRVHVI